MTLLPGYLDWHNPQTDAQRALRKEAIKRIRRHTIIGAMIGLFSAYFLGDHLWLTILMGIEVGIIFNAICHKNYNESPNGIYAPLTFGKKGDSPLDRLRKQQEEALQPPAIDFTVGSLWREDKSSSEQVASHQAPGRNDSDTDNQTIRIWGDLSKSTDFDLLFKELAKAMEKASGITGRSFEVFIPLPFLQSLKISDETLEATTDLDAALENEALKKTAEEIANNLNGALIEIERTINGKDKSDKKKREALYSRWAINPHIEDLLERIERWYANVKASRISVSIERICPAYLICEYVSNNAAQKAFQAIKRGDLKEALRMNAIWAQAIARSLEICVQWQNKWLKEHSKATKIVISQRILYGMGLSQDNEPGIYNQDDYAFHERAVRIAWKQGLQGFSPEEFVRNNRLLFLKIELISLTGLFYKKPRKFQCRTLDLALANAQEAELSDFILGLPKGLSPWKKKQMLA